MKNRVNVLKALRRQNPQSVPFDFTLCPSQIEMFHQMTGHDDYMEFFRFPFRYVELNTTRTSYNYKSFYTDLPQEAKPLNWNPEWGIYGLDSGTAHFQDMLHPMKNFSSIEELKSYPFPDFDAQYRWQGLDKQIEDMKRKDLIAIANMQMTIFEISWYLRGLDNFFVDMMTNPKLSDYLLEKVTVLREEIGRAHV